jgi:hypothetical protein
VASRFGYSAAFVMAVGALGAAAIAGRFVFSSARADKDSELNVAEEAAVG